MVKLTEGAITRMDRLIVIDDEPELGRFVGRVGESVGYEVRVTSQAKEFKLLVAEWAPSVIILDLAMPEVDGLDLLRWLAEENSKASIIIMSGFDPRTVDAAKLIGQERGLKVCYTFTKPVRVQDLKEKLDAIKTPKRELLTPLDLERGLKNGELFLVYQPIVSLKSGRLQGAEALIRWKHSERGELLPIQFLDLVSDPQLASQLTSFVVETSVHQQHLWAEQKLDLQLSINLCPSDLRDENLIAHMVALCEQNRVAANSITVQVTENIVMRDTLETFDVLTRLRLKGFQISIDDFGTGYFSLGRLRRLMTTEIKIDQSFVHNALASRDAQVIIKAALGVAHSMNLIAVAEGIETMEHYELMNEIGCDLGQGFGIAKPMLASELMDWHSWWKMPSRKATQL